MGPGRPRDGAAVSLAIVAASRIAPAPVDEGLEEPLGALLKRAEVRDALAWLRLLVDPGDAAAVVRALARPPIELRQVELARVIQVARRRKLDLVRGLAAVAESPQVPPEARERIARFVALHGAAAAELHSAPPDVFLGRLIELLHDRGRSLLAPQEPAGQRAALARLHRLAVDHVRATPLASSRDLARHLSSIAPDVPTEHDLPAHAAGPQDADLQATLQLLREEVLDGAARIAGRLGELRLDTELDIAHGLVRYLELLKVAALLRRPPEQSRVEALADINARLLAAASPLQREILLSSTLDNTLLAHHGEDAAAGERARASAVAPREQHSLVPFLPRRGGGLALSVSDINTYRSCPLRYKYARVLRIPTEQTVNQRFGIVVHQVLERYHREGGETLAQLLGLLDGCWGRAGFADHGPDGAYLEKARTALTRYHGRLRSQASEPVWFERQFQFQLGPHHLRGRVDRVDRLPPRGPRGDGAEPEYELIDYKTSRPKSPEQLRDDVQLSLYALAAREDWRLESSSQAYYYVLDDLKVPVGERHPEVDSVADVVLEVGEGILAQEFEPTPSPAACSLCDYRIVCPAAAV